VVGRQFSGVHICFRGRRLLKSLQMEFCVNFAEIIVAIGPFVAFTTGSGRFLVEIASLRPPFG